MTRTLFFAIQWILLFFLFNPSFLLLLNTGFDSYDLQRMIELAILTLTTIHLLLDLEFRQHSIRVLENFCTYKKTLLFGFFILGLISALHALYPSYALMELGTFFALFIFILSIAGAYSLQGEKFLTQFKFFILFTFAVNAIVALCSIVYAKNDPALLSTSNINTGMLANFLASPGYINRRFFDDVQAFLIPLLMAFFFLSPSRWKQGLLFLLISFCFARGFLDGSRIYFVEPVLLLVILPFLFRKKSLPFLGLLIATFVVGVLLYFALYEWNFSFAAHASTTGIIGLGVPQDRTLLNNRGLLWIIALHMIARHPLLGVGPLHFPYYAYFVENYAAHPHSALLVIAAEWGIPAFVLLLILIIGAIYSFCCKLQEAAASKEALYFRLGITGALIGGLAMMQIDGLILMPPGQMMLALMMGSALALFYGPQNPETLTFTSPRFRFYILFAAVVSLVCIAHGALPIAGNLPMLSIQYLVNCSFGCSLSPNYWSQGFIQFY